MKHIGLFEGIGGFSLAARWMGWETIAMCEIDKKCQRVLNKNFKGVTIHDDITKTDFSIYRGKCNILTAGFPCQPFSVAGLQKGTEDARHLWPETIRAVREIQPDWVIGENVYGLVNWSKGMVFEQVQANLEAAGYEVFSYVLPACGIGAIHRRERIWFIANRKSERTGRLRNKGSEERPQDGNELSGKQFRVSNEDVTNAISKRRCGRRIEGEHAVYADTCSEDVRPFDYLTRWTTEPPICGKYDGVSSRLDRLKQLGNAIVPQVALQIFKAIALMDAETQDKC